MRTRLKELGYVFMINLNPNIINILSTILFHRIQLNMRDTCLHMDLINNQ